MSLPKRLSPLAAIAVSILALAAVLWIDFATRELSVTLLYFLPVGIAAWFVGRKSAFAISLLAALGWFWVSYRIYVYRGLAPAVWDTFVTLAIFLIFGHTLCNLKAARDRLEISANLLETQVRERTSELDASNRELRETNEALQRRTEQLRSLSFELAKAEEQERRRIAHLLHDDLQQLLVAMKFPLTTLSSQTSDESIISSLDKIGALIDQSIAVSRSLTAELVPPMLYEMGLPEALKWLAGWMQQKHGIEVVVETDERREELAQDILSVLFQSTRELLFNVAKHSQVKKAMVTLCHDGKGTVAVCVRDEGVGFNPAAQEISTELRRGFGLVAMRERLAMIGGDLKIESAPGHGTTSTIVMPLRFEEQQLHHR